MATRIAAVLLAISCALGGGAAVADDGKMHLFRIASGAAGGTYFPMAGLLAQVVSNPPGSPSCVQGGNCGMPGLVAIAQSAQGSVANVASLDKDQVESGFAQSDVTYWAYTATGPFQGKAPVKKLCVLTSLYPEHVHLVARRASAIQGVRDLKGKTVALGLPASGSLVGARLVMSAHGLAEGRDFEARYVKPKTGADLVRDSKLDAFFDITGYPNVAIGEAIKALGMHLVPIRGPERDALIANAPFYYAAAIPGGVYKNHPDPVETVAVAALWLSRANLPEDLHYGVVKGLFENRQAAQILQNGHEKGKSVTLASHHLGVTIPYCKGAERFYREKSVYNPPKAP